MPTMIYHQAYPFNPDSVSASSVRPIRMHQAFSEAGYEVITISGYAQERRRAIRSLKRRLKQGLKVDFLYSESSTIPAMLTEKRHLPPHFFLEKSLFALCAKYSIPTGVFYRDIYWVFDEYAQRVGPVMSRLMRAVYRYELKIYQRYCSKIFVPSLAMMEHVPSVMKSQLAELPPGGQIRGDEVSTHPLHLLYIGGIDAHYDMRRLVEAVKRLPHMNLTMCVAPERWERVRDVYAIDAAPNIHVVHRKSHELDDLYAQANICLIMVDPTEYWEFAVPVKTFEYVGAGKPIMASEGTYIADFIEREGLGWKVPYDDLQIEHFLRELEKEPERVKTKLRQVLTLRERHSWLARAQHVAGCLRG